jgi:hypothetical protein
MCLYAPVTSRAERQSVPARLEVRTTNDAVPDCAFKYRSASSRDNGPLNHCSDLKSSSPLIVAPSSSRIAQ